MTARHLLLAAAFLLTLPMGPSCSSSSNNGKTDAARDTSGGADVADTRSGDSSVSSDSGGDADEDCENNPCPMGEECMPCQGEDGGLVYMCLPPDEAC